MDPRKPVGNVIDFERVRRDSRQPVSIARPVIAVGRPSRVDSLNQTLIWGSASDAGRERSPFGERTTLHDLKVASAPSLADELEARVNEVTRPRAKVEIESAEVRRLAAEVWASQPSVGLATMATTWRDQPLERPAPVEPRPFERVTEPVLQPQPVLQPAPEAPRLSTGSLSLLGQLFRRRFQLPAVRGTRGLRIACGALCAVCVAIVWMSLSGRLDARDVAAHAATPAPAQRPKPAAASGEVAKPAAPKAAAGGVAVASTAAPRPPASTNVSARSAVDALIAGKHDVALQRYRALAESSPGHPAYEAAARILAETEVAEQERW